MRLGIPIKKIKTTKICMAFTAIYVRLLLRHLLAVYYINAFRKTVPVV